MSTTTEEVATTMVEAVNAPSTMANVIVQTVQSIISSTTATTTTATAAVASSSITSTTTAATTTATTTTTTLGTPSSSSMSEKLSVSDLSSTLQHFGIVDYLVFIAMLAVCAVIGFYFGFIEKKQKKQKGQVPTDEKDGPGSAGIEERRDSEALDYLVGGRKMKVLPVSLSLVASFVSGISLLGTSTEIYVYGTQYAFILITLAISGIISWYIFLPVFCNLQLTSTYEYFELRFSKTTRLVASGLFTITTLIWLPMVIYVPALAFNQVTGINVHIITPAVCIVCIFYTTVGGLKAVVWTDVIQTVIMVGAVIFVVVKGTIDVGGLGVVIERNLASGRLEFPEFTFDPKVRMSVFALFAGYTAHSTYNVGCNQIITQRYLSLPSVKDMKKASVLFISGVVLLTALTLYNGVLLFATYYDCDPLTTKLAKAKDQLVPLLVMDTLRSYPGISGMFVAGVFSAALSSLSTALNSLAAVFLEDYIKPLCSKPLTERQTAITMRLCTVIIGSVSVGLVFVVERMGTHVMQLFMSLSSVTQGPLLALFVMGMLFPRLNNKSALAGALSSFLFMTWLCVNSQLALNSGELRYESKPVSIEGCTYDFERPLVTPANATFIATETASLGFLQQIYHISFMNYTLFSATVGVIVGYLSGFIFGRHEPEDVDVELLAPCMRRFYRSNYYFELRYGASIRNFGSVLFIVGTMLWLPVALYVPAITYNQVTGTGIHVITPIVCIICTFYTCVGGLKAVIWTDVIQSFVMYGSILTVCIKGTYDVGGLGVVLQRNEESGRLNAPEWTWDPTVRLSMLSVIVGGTLHKIQSSDVNQVSIQRFLSLPSYKHAKQSMLLFTILLTFLLSCCSYMGLVTYAVYHDCDPISTKLAKASDQLPSLLMMRTLGSWPGLPGLFVAGVFSAALSSMSTGLNSMACVISQDMIRPLLKKPLTERQTAFLLRGIVVFSGLCCMGLVNVVEKLGMVVQLATTTSAVSMGPLLGIYTMGVCLPWVNAKSALTGSLVSFVVLSWICIKAQLLQMHGEIRYPKMPVSVSGCDYEYDNATVWSTFTDYTPSTDRNIYHLSLFWYTALGGVICTVVALLAGLALFGWQDVSEMDPALITPCMRRFLPKKQYQAIDLEELFRRKAQVDGKTENGKNEHN